MVVKDGTATDLSVCDAAAAVVVVVVVVAAAVFVVAPMITNTIATKSTTATLEAIVMSTSMKIAPAVARLS